MNLATAFADTAAQCAGQTALFWGEEEITYGRLLDQTHWVARHLKNGLGVKAGDRVGLWLKNCPEFIPALFGALEAGAAVVPINNFLKPDEVNFILADAGIDILITEASMDEAVPRLKAARASLRVVRVEEFFGPGLTAPPLENAPRPGSQSLLTSAPTNLQTRSENDLALIIYTSGTTGHSKGAMLSHRNLLHNVESCRQVLDVRKDDRFVAVLPIFHTFMLTVCVLLPLTTGAAIVLVKSLHPPKSVILEIVQRRGTLLPAVPPFFRLLLNAALPADSPLRVCISGGAALPVQLLKDFNAQMPVPLVEGYGLSEASPVVSLNPILGRQKAGSIGVPVPGVEMSVQDDAGRFLETGQTGEICVRGGNVMLGYWNQPEETARALRNGWLLTGDVGHCDTDGYYYITDRKKDMLIVNGNNVYSREIEEVIYQLPFVKEAAVIGVPDARSGERPLAFVVPNDGMRVDKKAVLRHVRAKLANYKLPKQVVVMEALPRNATGKVLKTALRKMV